MATQQNWLDLSAETCVITGAGGGIGQRLAQGFAMAGAAVVLVDRGTEHTAALAAEIMAAGGKALALSCDVADVQAVSGLAERVETEIGNCSILVNNAGILRPGPLADVSDADWRRLFDVNFHGYFNMSRAFGHGMRARGKGALVHVASIAGNHPQPFSGAYSASKAAILMLSRQLAFEWGPDGVRSNTVSPGMIRTPLSAAFYADEEMTRRRESVAPLRRIADPQDIADAAVFLASPRASYISGQDIAVDGAFTQSLMSHIPRPGYE